MKMIQCNTYGEKEKCIENFGGKASKEKTIPGSLNVYDRRTLNRIF
jgi:hypothetical protein